MTIIVIIFVVLTLAILLSLSFITAPTLALLLILAGAIIFRLKFPVIKGAIGEWYVNNDLSKLGTSYSTFHDLYVPTEDGGTTQVDHVVTSPYGIFVIETKL
ncbi:nuclease-related domain-containing protein [Bacillaceae bacterium W0354]